MTRRKLAQFEVSSVGIGCMGFSHGYGALPPEEDHTPATTNAQEE